MQTSGMSGWTVTGAVFAGMAVVTGAIGAHGIDTYLAESYSGQTREIVGENVSAAMKYLSDFKTASQYQMAHGLGLIAVGILTGTRRRRALKAAGWLFVVGTCLFSGSLYWLSLFAHVMPDETRHTVGLMAATGGTSLIIGWCCFAAAACPCGQSTVDSRDET